MLDSSASIVLPSPSPETGAPWNPPCPASHGPCDRWFGVGEMARWSAPVAAPVPCRVPRQSVLVHEGARVQHLYVVQAGDFKVSRTAEDGYEQVIDFASAADIVGLDGLATGRHLGTAEALQDSTVYAVPIGDLRALRAANASFDGQLQQALSGQWGRMRDMAWLMGAVGADRRTARFLLQLSRRMAERGMSPRRLRLHMSRRDIAAHLGLAHESISRAMTALAASGYLRVVGREIEIVDMEGLRQLAASTRGHGADAAPACLPARAPVRPRAAADACHAH